MRDYDFYRNLVMNICSSLELSRSLSATYAFMEKEFPLVGISLHRYVPRLKAMHLHFLVTGDGFYDLDTLIPMTDEDVEEIEGYERNGQVRYEKRVSDSSVATKHNRAIAAYIPGGERSYMVAFLSVGDEVVGHLCLIGKGVECFTREHEHKLQLARAPVSLAMVNMLQHKRTIELQQRLDQHRKELAGEVEFLKNSRQVGREGGLRETMEMVEQLAGKEVPVLILGETGTGKEMIADAVQKVSPRSNGPYVKINCGAIPDSLMDSELFGYQKGAFTGALTNRPGKFEQADGGTLFLDEVGELSPQAQVRLLRVLQEGVVERLGGTRPIPVNVRIIAATNRPLEKMLREGSFRDDLFYRLNVFPIHLPPLRDRKEDIPLLAHYFLQDFSQRMKLSHEVQLDVQSLPLLQRYSWPGNIRELKNLVERALTLDTKGPVDLAQYLPSDTGWFLEGHEKDNYLKDIVRQQVIEILNEDMEILPRKTEEQKRGAADSGALALDEVVAAHIRRVLDSCNGKISGPGGAAEVLQINPSTLRKRMKRLGIQFKNKVHHQQTDR